MRKEHFVFITGYLCDQSVFKKQADILSNKVILHIIESINFDTMDEVFKHINSTINEPFILSGHSLGGWLAIEYLNQFPDKVNKLILMSCNADKDDPSYRQKRLERMKKSSESNVDEYLELYLCYLEIPVFEHL